MATKKTTKKPEIKPAKKVFDYAGWEKRDDVAIGDTVSTSREINGMFKGARLKVKEIQGGGAVFACEVLTSRKAGSILRVRATDIQ